MKVSGFSHITMNVKNLSVSLDFYVHLLEAKLVHRGEHDVYLRWGNAWICLQESQGQSPPSSSSGIDHVAFFLAEHDFEEAVTALKQAGIPIVRGPLRRGTGWSINFLDPDGIQLELHTSTLEERMKTWQ